MNKRCCQYPFCFTWEELVSNSEIKQKNKLLKVNSSIPIVELLAESEFKCVYDKDKNDTAEVYVSCFVLEKTFHLGVNLTDSVKDVKNRIKRLEKIPIALMHLFFNERLLKDHQALYECRIKNKSALILGIKLHTAFCEKCMKVYTTSDTKPTNITLRSITGPSYEVTLPLATTIENLKETIDEKYGIYPDHQLIIHNGKRLEDDVTLEEYGVTNTSDLLFIPYQFDNCGFCSGCAKAKEKPTIILKFLDSKVVWALHPKQTVRKLKETSYQFLHHIHPDLQQVILKNKELNDLDTLEVCGVRDGSKLKIKLKFYVRKCDRCSGSLL